MHARFSFFVVQYKNIMGASVYTQSLKTDSVPSFVSLLPNHSACIPDYIKLIEYNAMLCVV